MAAFQSPCLMITAWQVSASYKHSFHFTHPGHPAVRWIPAGVEGKVKKSPLWISHISLLSHLSVSLKYSREEKGAVLLVHSWASPLLLLAWELGIPASWLDTSWCALVRPSQCILLVPLPFEGHCSLLPFSSSLLWEISSTHAASTIPQQQRTANLVSSVTFTC